MDLHLLSFSTKNLGTRRMLKWALTQCEVAVDRPPPPLDTTTCGLEARRALLPVAA